MKKIGRTDRSTPIPGRSWYAGAWRTPQEIEARRAYTRRHRAAIGGAARHAREQGERMRDRTVPVEGREWYAGRWRTPEEVVRTRDRMRAKNRARYVPRVRQTRLSPEEATRRAGARRLRAIEQRRAARRLRDQVRERERAERVQAPNEVRTVWRRASNGSIIRRKYPTMDALNAGARRGEFDHLR